MKSNLPVILSAGLLMSLSALRGETVPLQPALKPPEIQSHPKESPKTELHAGIPKPFTKIESDLLNFDYDKRIAIFEGNVLAVDPQLTLQCKIMKVYIDDKTSEVVRVEAFGNVHLLHGGKEGTSEKAVYTRETGMIVLSEGTPKLKDEKGNWIHSRGNGIIYNVNTHQLNVDKPTLEFQTSESPSTP